MTTFRGELNLSVNFWGGWGSMFSNELRNIFSIVTTYSCAIKTTKKATSLFPFAILVNLVVFGEGHSGILTVSLIVGGRAFYAKSAPTLV